MTPILEVKNLKKHYPIRKGLLNKLVGTKYVVDGISFSIDKGKTLALVGESGCGKSVLLRVLLGLEAPTEGEVLFHGKNIATMSAEEIREKQRKMQMIFQDSLGALHPRFTVEKSLEEPLAINGMKDRKSGRRSFIIPCRKSASTRNIPTVIRMNFQAGSGRE